MAGPKGASLPWARGGWGCGRRGSTSAGGMGRGRAGALGGGSCRPTCAGRPRWPRCCPSCTCAGSPPAISAPRSKGCWARTRLGCRRPTLHGLPPAGRKNTRRFAGATSPAASTFTCGSMGCISTSGSQTTGWCHKLANVLDKLPQRLQPRAKRALHEMMYAECRTDCAAERSRFEAEYQAKYAKAVESLTANWERLVTFFDFPAEHWKHLRTTNVIESPFPTVRLRERATRGAGSRTKGLLIASKLLHLAPLRSRHLAPPHLF